MSGYFHNWWTRYTALSLLYFVEGAPYGFQTSCLPLLLRHTGVSLSRLGLMRLLFLPWVCKPLYTPIIERTRSRRWWLVMSLVSLACSCFLAATTVGEEDITSISFILTIMNLSSAVQDVCVDSLAINILLPSELGIGNTIQVVGYKAGMVVSGTLLLWWREAWGWISMWFAFGLLYCVAIILVVSVLEEEVEVVQESKEKEKEKREERQEKNEREEEERKYEHTERKFAVSAIMEDLIKVVAVPGTPWMIGLVLFYKLAERGEFMLPMYLVDKGIPLARMSLLTGLFRSLASVAGSCLGGYLLSYRGMNPVIVLRWSAWTRCIPLLLHLMFVVTWGPTPVDPAALDLLSWDTFLLYCTTISMILSAAIAGLLTTSCFTLMMQLSRQAGPTLQASHYSLLATMEVAGKLAFASISGGIIDIFGFEPMLLLLLLLGLLTPLVISDKELNIQTYQHGKKVQ